MKEKELWDGHLSTLKDGDGEWCHIYRFAVGDVAVFRGTPRPKGVGIEIGRSFMIDRVDGDGWIWSQDFPNSMMGYELNYHNNDMFVPIDEWKAANRQKKLKEIGI